VPEGDTIFRTARALDQALAGRELTRFEAPRLRFAPFPTGTLVEGADSVGKHCLVRFDDGRVLHTHMQMTGSWHLYRPAERWQRKPAAMRAVIEVPEWVAVCFAAPVVELTDQPPVDHLGPDLCRPDADLDESVRRLGDLSPPDRTIGEALLDQRVVAGIGNIYRCETCFLVRASPKLPVGRLPDPGRAITVARTLLLRNADRPEQSTTGELGPANRRGRQHWVYLRDGRPCRRCGTRVGVYELGDGVYARSAYHCPGCQPEPW
jgi:endonuclease-8